MGKARVRARFTSQSIFQSDSSFSDELLGEKYKSQIPNPKFQIPNST